MSAAENCHGLCREQREQLFAAIISDAHRLVYAGS